jgi:hypothetical protein
MKLYARLLFLRARHVSQQLKLASLLQLVVKVASLIIQHK